MTKDHLFDIASVTKIFTSTLILKLIDEGKLSLETELGDIFPVISEYGLEDISIYELLTHSSGLLNWFPFYTLNNNPTHFFVDLKKVDNLKNTKGKVVYSDINFMLLGEVIKKIFNESLNNVIKGVFQKELMMDNVTYYPHTLNLPIVATEYGNQIETGMCKERNLEFNGFRTIEKAIIGEVNDGNAHYYWNGEAGHAGLFSTSTELLKLSSLYLNVSDNINFLSNDIKEKAINTQTETRCLGFEKNKIYPSGIGHTGFTGTAIWIDPAEELAVCFLTNRLHVNKVKSINEVRRKVFYSIYNKIKKGV